MNRFTQLRLKTSKFDCAHHNFSDFEKLTRYIGVLAIHQCRVTNTPDGQKPFSYDPIFTGKDTFFVEIFTIAASKLLYPTNMINLDHA